MAQILLSSLSVLSTALIALGSITNGTSNANMSRPIVDLGYASYQGTTLTPNVTSFLNIRYAAPPTGLLRFQAPQPPATIAGIQDASVEPAQCYQSGFGTSSNSTNSTSSSLSQKRDYTPTQSSEDCLFLSVVVPNFESAKALRVVVWLHGGGFQSGNISGYSQSDLVHDSLNRVIAVFIQYRLGAFGFLAGATMEEKGALNAGLLDQTLGLQWVQQYISKFGGDPSQVTIWGESGAGSVMQHMVANGGHTDPPLFRAALTSSTVLNPQYPGNHSIPTQMYEDVLNLTSCSNNTDSFACLVAVDAEVLNDANAAVAAAGFYGTPVWVPVVDGTFIKERVTVTLGRGILNGDVLLSVTNTFEGAIFVSSSVTNITDYVKELFPLLTSDQAVVAANIYRELNVTLPSAVDQAVAIMGESIFICPTYYLLEGFKGKSWKGEFAIPPGHHTDDVPYYFTSFTSSPLGHDPVYNNTVFTTAFSQSFMDVVLGLDPNTKINSANLTPQWPTWSTNTTEMLFNKTTTDQPDIREIPTDPALLKRCAFWHSVANATHQ